MSQAVVQSVIARAVSDAEFRGRLLQSPSSTLADYALSSSEVMALRRLTAESFDGPAAELEARLSRSLVWGGIAGDDGKTSIVWGG
jgi:hypothetical protein